MEHNSFLSEFQLPDGKDTLQTAQKCYQLKIQSFANVICTVHVVSTAIYIMSEMLLCTIKIFRGGGRGGDTFKTLSPPLNNFCLYPPPILRNFWKDPLMTPHHPTSSIFHCYPPHPIHHPFPPLKILIKHLLLL